MSHFVVLVIGNEKTSGRLRDGRVDVSNAIAPILDPFDENKSVDPYEEDCWCCTVGAKLKLQREMVEKAGFGAGWIDTQRGVQADWVKAKGGASKVSREEQDAHWKSLLSPLTAAEDRAKAEIDAMDPARLIDPECEDCKGTAKVMTTCNPRSKWDWWQVGGRWTGMMDPEYDPQTDPNNIEKCDLCGGTGRLEVCPDRVATWVGADAALGLDSENDPGVNAEVSTLIQAGKPAQALLLKRPHKEFLHPDTGEAIDHEAVAVLEEEGRHVFCECNGCRGVGQRLAWPTQWVRHTNDVVTIEQVQHLVSGDDFKKYIPFALLIETDDGNARWIEKGKMGWFGMGDDHESAESWQERVREVIAEIDPSRVAVVVDCHI